VLLLHGIGSNAHSFESLMAALPQALDAIAWNAPGYGGSGPLASTAPGPRDYADALKAALDALGIARTVLVGHSLGALFAASFATTYPERVSVLVLMSPALGYRVQAGAPLPESVQSRIDEINALGPAAFSDKRSARLVGDPQKKPHVLAAVRRAMASLNPVCYAQAVHALGAGDLLADAASIEVPTLIVVGSRDVVTPPSNARAANNAFSSGIYHEIKGAGHALPQEEPGAIAKLLTVFLREHADVHAG
jgi:pimeloyl-ACP methyl ester carboxylesterase